MRVTMAQFTAEGQGPSTRMDFNIDRRRRVSDASWSNVQIQIGRPPQSMTGSVPSVQSMFSATATGVKQVCRSPGHTSHSTTCLDINRQPTSAVSTWT